MLIGQWDELGRRRGRISNHLDVVASMQMKDDVALVLPRRLRSGGFDLLWRSPKRSKIKTRSDFGRRTGARISSRFQAKGTSASELFLFIQQLLSGLILRHRHRHRLRLRLRSLGLVTAFSRLVGRLAGAPARLLRSRNTQDLAESIGIDCTANWQVRAIVGGLKRARWLLVAPSRPAISSYWFSFTRSR